MTALKTTIRRVEHNSDDLKDSVSYYSAVGGGPEMLSSKLVYAFNQQRRDKYAFTAMTLGNEGFGGGGMTTQDGKDGVSDNTPRVPRATKEIEGEEFMWPVMGNYRKLPVCLGALTAEGLPVTATRVGIGNSKFILIFQDNWIKANHVIESPNGTSVFAHKYEQKGDVWHYLCQLDPAEPFEYLAPSEYVQGSEYAVIANAGPMSESDTTESNFVTPGLVKNQLNLYRQGVSFAGNAGIRNLPKSSGMYLLNASRGDAKTSPVFMDEIMHQFHLKFFDDIEYQNVYGKYNRSQSGLVLLKHLDSDKPILRSSGVLEMINNKTSHGFLTYADLLRMVTDAYYGGNIPDGGHITIFTGLGGMEDIDMALKTQGKSLLNDFGMVADKFVTGNANNLRLGGFFDSFFTISGILVTVKRIDIFDNGDIARKSRKHPLSGKSLESHRLVGINTGDFEGTPNLEYISQKGRNFMWGIHQGLTPIPECFKSAASGSIPPNLLSTTKDLSHYTQLHVGAISMQSSLGCFDSRCIAS